MADNPFTRHLDEVGESYGAHLIHAGRFGFRMISGGIACLIHGMLPFLCTHTGSQAVRDLHRGMTKRADAPNWERHPII